MGLRDAHTLLSAISRTQTLFLEDADSEEIFGAFLKDILSLSGSEYGFIGEVLTDSAGQPYLKTHAITNISWDEATQRLYDQSQREGMVFSNLNTLFGKVIETGEVVIANEPASDPRRSGLPDGHPLLDSFLGMPVRAGNEVVGMVGIANRAGGYDRDVVDYLQPLLDTYGRLIALMRNKQQRDEMQLRLSRVVESAVDAILVIDSQGVIQTCNPATETIFGYPAEEMIDRNVAMLMPESQRQRHDVALDRYEETGESMIVGVCREEWAQRANGEMFPVRLCLSEFSVNGERFFTGIVSDISNLKNSEGRSQRLKMVLDQVHDSVFVFDADTLLFNYVNQSAMRQSGYSQEELFGLKLVNIIPAFDEMSFQKMVAPLKQGERDSMTFSTLHRCYDGEEVMVEVLLQYVIADHESPFFIAVMRDISERLNAEKALRESDERLRHSQVFANIGTWDWDIQTGDLFWSERIAPLFGYPEGELETTYENFLNAVHPDDRQRVIDAVNACVDSGVEYNIEHRCIWPDGTVHWLLERGDVVRDEDGEPLRMLGVVQDITELKQVEADLVSAKEEAERANRAKSNFLSSMSHELRTPLNAIMGFAQLFNYDFSATEQHRQTAEEIYLAGKHLRTLIDDVLDLAKIEAGVFEVVLEPVSVVQVINECRTLITPLAEKQGVTLKVCLEQCNDAMVLANQTRLKQVLLNLLSNAVKYNRVQGTVTIACSQSGEGFVRISVSDTGIGIASQDMHNLFKPFSRLVNDQSNIEGTGIGLSITKQFVELMQGEIGVESEAGKGSTFWVELKASAELSGAQAAVQDGMQRRRSSEVANRHEISDAKILVIEDNPTNRTVFMSQLQALGYKPEIVSGPHEVLAKLKSSPYDLILTDINMPEMDGYELVRYIRALEEEGPRHTPIIAVTANALPGERDRCLKAGMEDYIPKPVDIEVLRHTLSHWLGSAELHVDFAEKRARPEDAPVCVNLARLAALVGGDVRQQRAIINNFFETLPETLAEIHAAFNHSDAAALYFWSHRFKSSAAAVGAETLAQMCQALEDFTHEHEWGGIASLIGELDSQIQRVVKELKAALQEFEQHQTDQRALTPRTQGIGVVLVVDDDPVILYALEAALQGVGVAEVLTAKSGEDALRHMKRRQDDIDVVLCDLNMPVMDGVEFLRHLVARDYRGAIILLSGEDSRILSSARTLADAHSFHFVDAMAKPVEQARLAEVLAAIKPGHQTQRRAAPNKVSLDELEKAVREDQFVVYYQPKIDTFSRQMVGVESLVRWQHPEKNFIMPDQFIPLAEQNGLIDELTDLVLDKAFAQLKQWRSRGLDLTVSVNIAVGTIGRRIDFPERVMGCLETYGLKAEDVILELTESGLMKDIATTLDALVRLRLKGVILSIDDFGTGYSTFKQLQGIPFSELKIDREFVMNALTDPASRAILESSVLLGQKLGMSLVAEGVESERDWVLLRELGCHMIQGFHVSRPMPGDRLEEWYAEWSVQAGQT